MISIDIIIPIFNLSLYQDSFDMLYKKLIKSHSSTLILVNDGSTDNTSQLLKSLYEQNPSRVRLIEYAKNQGQGYARNLGFKASSSDYILFLDADDQISSSDYIDIAREILNSNPSDILLLPFASRPLGSNLLDFLNGRKYTIDKNIPPNPEERISLLLLDRISVSPCNKIVSANLLRSIQAAYCCEIFPPELSCEDIIYTYRLLKLAQNVCISSMSECYIYQIRQGSTMNSVTPRTYDILEVFKLLSRDVKKSFPSKSMSKELKSFFFRECIVNVQRKLCYANKFSKQQLFAYCSALDIELKNINDGKMLTLLFSSPLTNRFVLFLLAVLIAYLYKSFRGRQTWL